MMEQWSIISLGWVLLAIRKFDAFEFIFVIIFSNITIITIYDTDYVRVYTHMHGTWISSLSEYSMLTCGMRVIESLV